METAQAKELITIGSHPNTKASIIASALSGACLWLLGRYTHLHLSGAADAGALAATNAAVLFVGRQGIRGTLSRLWTGASSVWKGAPAKPAATSAAPAPTTPSLP